nr:DUF4209 domain-containing protein [Deinococcus arboris]
MFTQQTLNYTVTALPVIQAARLALLEEHDVRTEDLLPILQACPIVQPDHLRSICTGLIDGLYGNFLAAAHTLVPQLEHALRELVDLMGGLTSRVDADGTQDAVDLGTLLRPGDQATLLEDALGPDFLFQLRGFLVERHGANFRNKIAHGLAGDREVHTYGQVAWHLMWQVVTGLAAADSEAGPATV